MYCEKCGAKIDEGAAFCASCGAPVGKAAEETSANTENAQTKKNQFAAIMDSADLTGGYDAADINANKVFGIFAYLSILVLIPILAAPNSKFARFHANQGLLLLICSIAYSIVSSILSIILAFIPFIGGIIIGVLGLASLAFLALAIIGIINVCNGKAKELPIIGRYRLIK